MSSELSSTARPRPLRIAFLVEDGDHSDLILDGIFADCYDRWGGRFSLIAPCINGRISESYWPWLETFDPDVVYSYVALSEANVLEIHERIHPGRYIYRRQHGEPRLDVFGFKPSYDFTPLESLSILFRVARFTFPGQRGGPAKIIDKQHGGNASRWLTDSFGTYLTSRSTGIFPVDALSVASLLAVVPAETRANPRIHIPQDLETVPSELAAFAEFAARRATSMSLASLLLAPKLDIDNASWSRSFNLVIGDSFADRVLFWNARLLIPAWLDQDLCCFRLDESQLDDPDFIRALGDLLKYRNHVNAGSGGQSDLTIRSCSLGLDRLQIAQQKIAATRPWGPLHVEAIAGLDALVPSAHAFSRAREAFRERGVDFGAPTRKDFVWVPPTLRPPLVAPDHLADAPSHQHFAQGFWATDYFIEQDGPRPRFANKNRWELPRRWRMAGAFKIIRAGGQGPSFLPATRPSRGGALVVTQCLDQPIESIVVPTVQAAMGFAFATDGAWARELATRGEIYPPSKVVWTSPSNESRYLAGVLGMTHGLDWAEEFLLHPFLTMLFAKFGGSTGVPAEKLQPIVNLLAKQVGHTPIFDLRIERERKALATMIGKAGKNLATPSHALEYQKLRADWNDYLTAYKAQHSDERETDATVDWSARERASLDRCLIAMRGRKMVFQGHRWTCGECHHRNWFDLASLSSELTCEVCGNVEDAPIDIKWLFRPNEFLIESLRDHSTLSLIWALAILRERSRSSFLYSPPTRFGYSEDNNSDAEADLLVVSDGSAIVCEVKASWQVVRAADVRKLVALAERLRADEALLAVMDQGIQLKEELDRANADLRAVGIKFTLMTWEPNPFHEGTYLPG